MNEKRSSTLLLILALALGAVVAWYGLGALWHLLLRMMGVDPNSISAEE